jgi:hypothetical protein
MNMITDNRGHFWGLHSDALAFAKISFISSWYKIVEGTGRTLKAIAPLLQLGTFSWISINEIVRAVRHKK